MPFMEAYLDENYITLCSGDKLKHLKEKMYFQQIRDYVPFMEEVMELEPAFGIVLSSFFYHFFVLSHLSFADPLIISF